MKNHRYLTIPLGSAIFIAALFIFLFGFLVGNANAHSTATASWYGPGLYGNRTANGTVLTPSTWGVAHKSMRFGTRLTICYRTRCAKVRVIDRGPFIHGRTFDLTAAVAQYLRFRGVQTVRWSYAR